jgi:hypothetical protein
MALAPAGVAQPVAFIKKWTLSAATGKVDVTAFEDDNIVKLAGKDDASGTYEGWWDDATVQTYTAATDGVARRAYFYPDATVATIYWHGDIFVDYSIEVAHDNAIPISGSWEAASNFIRVG